MVDLKSLFDAHTPQTDYLTSMCRHYYCSFLSVAELISAPEHTVESFTHAHDAYEFLIPLTPLPLIAFEGSVYFGQPGFVYPVSPGAEHGPRIECADIANCNITADREAVESRMRLKGLADARFDAKFESSRELQDYIRLLCREFMKGAAADKSDLNALGSLIISALIELGCRPAASRPVPEKDYQRGMRRVVDYMSRNYCDDISLDFLAEMCGLTKSHFITSFKKMYGEPPYSHILRLRIAKAKILLRNTDLPVADVAEECGFKKQSTFANMFKTAAGTTPTQYRTDRDV